MSGWLCIDSCSAFGLTAMQARAFCNALLSTTQPPGGDTQGTIAVLGAFVWLQGHEGEEGDAQVAPEQERDILHSVIDDILGGDAGAGGQAATKKQPNGGAAQQGATSDDEAGEAARAGGAVSEDMFSRRALIERSAAQRAALERLDRKLQTKPVGRTKGDGERDLPKVGVEAEEGQQGEQQAATVFVRGLPLDVTKQQVLTKLQVRPAPRQHAKAVGRSCPALHLPSPHCPWEAGTAREGGRGSAGRACASLQGQHPCSELREPLQGTPLRVWQLCRRLARSCPAGWWWTRSRGGSRGRPLLITSKPRPL